MVWLKAALALLLGVFCTISGQQQSDLLRMKMSGELRKACSKRGNPIQPPSRVNTTSRLDALRRLMVNETVTEGVALDAYLVTPSDEHQSEFVAEHDRRREHVSGFSGSYGDAIVTGTKAVLWTDGRYHLQADDQLDCNWLLMREGHANISTKQEWLKREFPGGAVVGADPKLVSQSMWQYLRYDLTRSGIRLQAIERNLVDAMWKDKPPRRNKDVFVWSKKYSGKSWMEKVKEVRIKINESGADAMVVTALDETAWLLNLRGRDIPYNPFVRSYVILDMFDIHFFVNHTQLRKHHVLKYFDNGETRYTVRIHAYEDICTRLHTLAQSYRKILVPSAYSSSPGASRFIFQCVPGGKRLPSPSPIIFLKAVKNRAEIQGMYNAHVRDGAAMCEFLYYFTSKFKGGSTFTELEAVKILNEFRFEQKHSLGNSFRTIAAYGPNGAQPHYEPTPNTNVMILDNSTLVLDSGGQYYDGTTDVTRTIHLGTPTEDHKQAYTRVLMGQIQLSTLTFPSNMRTSVADVMARAPLWEVGLDYLHGTSHGVGSFLGVHESPVSMSYEEAALGYAESQELQPGYFLSNEPGLYREGEFGVRLENVLEVVDVPWLTHTAGHSFRGFKVVTLVPYEMKLIDLGLLSVYHRRWLNAYNEKIRLLVGAELKKQNLMDGFYWMMENTVSVPEYGQGSVVRSRPAIVLSFSAIVVAVNPLR